MSTSSLSRSEFIDLRSLNNLVVWILSDLPVTFSILSKQNVLKTHWRFSQPWRSKSPYTLFVIFLPERWISNTFDTGFESACSVTCIGVTHQGIRCIFWYHFAILHCLSSIEPCVVSLVCSLPWLWQTWHKMIQVHQMQQRHRSSRASETKKQTLGFPNIFWPT